MLGRTIRLDQKPYTVVGVARPGFGFPNRSDLWIPLPVPFPPATATLTHGLPLAPHTIARLAPGVSVNTANARLIRLWDPELLPQDLPQRDIILKKLKAAEQHTAVPLQASLTGDRRTTLLILLGATGLLLLIACGNATNLLLAQAAARRREMAVRAVLGAGRGRLAKELLIESVMLAAGGAACGVVLATIGARLVDSLMPSTLTGLATASVDLRVLLFSVVLALGTGVWFGLWPAVATSRADLAASVRGTGVTGATTEPRRTGRRALLSSEIALSVALVVGAALMLQSFARLTRVNAGFNATHVVSLELDFGSPAPPEAVRRERVDEILTRLRASPGVDAAAAAGSLPLRAPGPLGLGITGEGVAARLPGARPQVALYDAVSSEYFAVMGMPLIQGRTFRPGDESQIAGGASPQGVVVSRGLVDSLWPGGDPLGRWISWSGRSERLRVVGVVPDVHQYALDRRPLPAVYRPLGESVPASLALVARGTLPSNSLIARMRDAVHAADPSLPVYDAATMDDVIRASVAVPRADTQLMVLFGTLALLLAMIGVYGVVAFSVAQRRREFGIRAALGASAGNLVRLVAQELVWVTVIGLVVGLAGAWAAARVFQSLLYGIAPHDLGTFVVAPLALVVLAALASLGPARRAARTNPVDVIREG